MLKKDRILRFIKDSSTKTLVAIIEKTKKVIVKREVAIKLLFMRTGPEINQVLIDAVKENSGQLQSAIIKNLCSRPDKIIDLFLMDFVVKNQKQPDYETFKEVFKYLSDRPGHTVTGFLMDSVWSAQVFILVPAIKALTYRLGSEVDQVLIECSMDKRWNRYQEAFEALRTRPGSLIDEVLIAASKNEGEFGNKDTGYLSNSTEYLENIRWAAAKAMRGRVGEKIDEVLITLANDKCKYTRLAAIKSMADRNSPKIKKALKKASKARGIDNIEIAETASYILSGSSEANDIMSKSTNTIKP